MELYPCHEALFLLPQKKENPIAKAWFKSSGGSEIEIDSSLRFLTKFWFPQMIEIGFYLLPSRVAGPPICEVKRNLWKRRVEVAFPTRDQAGREQLCVFCTVEVCFNRKDVAIN